MNMDSHFSVWRRDLYDWYPIPFQLRKGMIETGVISFLSRILFFCCILIMQQQRCAANDTLSLSQQLFVGQTLVSAGQIFELVFFKPGNSSRVYLGLWYKNIPMTRVWVANRGVPLTDLDSVSHLAIGNDGNLRITDAKKSIIWSSNVSTISNNTIAVLMDTGNFVLKDMVSGLILWESFNYPVDTFLPSMRIGFNIRTGEKRFLSSWQTENNPSSGGFVAGLWEEIPTQPVTWNGSKPFWRGGPWNGWQFVGIPDSDKGFLKGMNVEQNSQGANFSFYTYNASHIRIMVLTSKGSLKIMQWEEETNNWKVTWEAQQDPCDVYGFCGPFGVCSKNKSPVCECLRVPFGVCSKNKSPVCECLRGYIPKSYEEWSKGNWTGGCLRIAELQCQTNTSYSLSNRSKHDRFLKLSGIKLPDSYQYFCGVNVLDCERWCMKNCSCVGYAYPDGIGYMAWTTDLVDIEQSHLVEMTFSFALLILNWV